MAFHGAGCRRSSALCQTRFPLEAEAPNRAGHAAKLLPADGQPTFEQHDRGAQRDEREEQGAQQRIGIDQAGHRTGHETHDKQYEDRRYSQPPGQPLRAGAQRQQADQPCYQVFM